MLKVWLYLLFMYDYEFLRLFTQYWIQKESLMYIISEILQHRSFLILLLLQLLYYYHQYKQEQQKYFIQYLTMFLILLYTLQFFCIYFNICIFEKQNQKQFQVDMKYKLHQLYMSYMLNHIFYMQLKIHQYSLLYRNHLNNYYTFLIQQKQ